MREPASRVKTTVVKFERRLEASLDELVGVDAGLEPADDLVSPGERPALNHRDAVIGIGVGDPALDHRFHRLGRIAAGRSYQRVTSSVPWIRTTSPVPQKSVSSS